MDDLQAIHRLKNGDIGGLESLIARYQAKALRTAFLVTQDEMTAEDVVYGAFVRFYERIRQFDEKRAFEPYFLRSVVNAALNSMRGEKKHTRLDAETEPLVLENLLAQAAQVEDEVEFLQAKQQIRVALLALPARQRTAIILRYYLDMNEKEMALELDAPPGTIKWLLNAARARLRELLGAERFVE